jgi:hypothetical protein
MITLEYASRPGLPAVDRRGMDIEPSILFGMLY